MYRTGIKIIPILLVISFLNSCIDITTKVLVKKDGSGFITQTAYLSPMFSSLTDLGNALENKTNNLSGSIHKNKNYLARVDKLGKGVEFKSVKTVKRTDGAVGETVIYTFSDIRDVTISPDMDPGMFANITNIPDTDDDPEAHIRFGFVPGRAPRLTVDMSDIRKPGNEKAKKKEVETEDLLEDMPEDDSTGGMWPMQGMLGMVFQGMRIRMIIQVDGEITDSNATWIFNSRKTKKKSFVTLMDIDFGELAAKPENISKLSSLSEDTDFNQLQEALKDIDGVKIETKEVVNITFN